MKCLSCVLCITVFATICSGCSKNEMGPSAPPLTLSGVVLDSDTGSPIAGVRVATTDNSVATSTDDMGRYTLTCPSCWCYEFQKHGYEGRFGSFCGENHPRQAEESVTLQRRIEIDAGDRVVGTINPNEKGTLFED